MQDLSLVTIVPERNFYSVFAALATTEYMQRNNAKSLKTTAMKKKRVGASIPNAITLPLRIYR